MVRLKLLSEGAAIARFGAFRAPPTLKIRAGSFQDVADVSKLLTESEYDSQKLLALAKRARVDKKLMRLAERLGLSL